MRWVTRAVAAGVVALGVAIVVTAAPMPVAAAEALAALVVPATGATVTTPFATSPSVLYTITVSGTFAADRTGAFADCGYRDTNAGVVGQDWQPGDAGLLVNGTRPWCGPYSAAHRYAFRVPGTGAPLAFSVADASGTADNAGALTVEVLAESALRARCYVDATGVAAGGGGELSGVAVVAVAWHEGVLPDVAATSVECVASQGTPGEGWRATWAGPLAEAHGLAWFDPLEPVSVCVSASDTRIDGTRRSTGWSCSTQLLEEKT